MYLYFDKNGVLREIINDKPPRQGDLNVNKIYVYYENAESEDVDKLSVSCKLFNPILNTISIFVEDTVTDHEIPYNSKRDLKWFKYYTPYDFFIFDLSDILNADESSPLDYAGVIACSISCYSSDVKVQELGMFTFNVAESAESLSPEIQYDGYLSLSQFKYLLSIMRDGAVYFTPSVSENGVISWTNNGDLENPTPVNIKGPKGDDGILDIVECDGTETMSELAKTQPFIIKYDNEFYLAKIVLKTYPTAPIHAYEVSLFDIQGDNKYFRARLLSSALLSSVFNNNYKSKYVFEDMLNDYAVLEGNNNFTGQNTFESGDVDVSPIVIKVDNNNTANAIDFYPLDSQGQPYEHGYHLDFEADNISADRQLSLPNESGILATREYAVAKTSNANKLYGTDSSGNQTTYNENDYATKNYVQSIASGLTNKYVLSVEETMTTVKTKLQQSGAPKHAYLYKGNKKFSEQTRTDITNDILNGDYDSITIVNYQLNNNSDSVSISTNYPNKKYMIFRPDDYNLYFVELLDNILFWGLGDVIYVIQTNIPDRWVQSSGGSTSTLYALESKTNLSNYYSKSVSLIPSANNTYDIGSDSYAFKDLFLAGKINPNSSGYGLALPSTSGLGTANSELVDTKSEQTISGVKTFDPGKLKISNIYSYSGNKLMTVIDGAGTYSVGFSGSIKPDTSVSVAHDIGESSKKWRDIYLSGGLRDGNNANYKLTLPDTTSWTANKTIATLEDLLPYAQFKGHATCSELNTLVSNTTDKSILQGHIYVVTDSGNLNYYSGQSIVNIRDIVIFEYQMTSTSGSWGWRNFSPDNYIKSASISGNTLTLTKQNGTTVTFSDTSSGSGVAVSFLGSASAYDNTATYSVGDVVIYQNAKYKCTTAVTVAEDFDSSKWTEITIDDYVTLSTNQTISGDKLFAGKLIAPEFYSPQPGGNNKKIFDFYSSTRINDTLQPGTDNTYDLGTSSRRFKDLYLSGSVYTSEIRATSGSIVAIRCDLRSAGGEHNIGTNSYPFQTIYLTNGLRKNNSTYGITLPNMRSWAADKEIATTDYFWQYAINSTTQLEFNYINNISISVDTTFTLATAPADTYPEYKANITNTDTSNAITITLPAYAVSGGTTIIKTNDVDITVSSNTFTIPAGTTVELNIVQQGNNYNVIVFNWSAQ